MLNIYFAGYAYSESSTKTELNSSTEDLGSTMNEIKDKTISEDISKRPNESKQKVDSQEVELKPETQKGELNSLNEDLGITVNKIQNETRGKKKKKLQTYIDTLGSNLLLISGDFRYRLENEQERTYQSDNIDVLRSRIRLRLKLRFDITDNLNIISRFATGNGSARSTNQTLGNGFENEANWFDLAYVNYHTKRFIIDAGKMQNIFETVVGSGLIWDGDTNPEGVQASHRYRRGMILSNAVIGHLVLRSDDNRKNAYLGAIQTSLSFFLKSYTLLLGATYYDWRNIQFEDGDLNEGGGFQYTDIPYKQPEFYMIFTLKKSPISFFGDYVKNIAVEDKNIAWLAGFAFKGYYIFKDFKLSYYWRYIEKNSVINQFMDSDFNAGEPNAEGNSFFIKYKFNSYFELAFTHLNAISLENESDHIITDFMDIKWKF